MAIGTQPDVQAEKNTWLSVGQNKQLQWKSGANVLVHLATSTPPLSSYSGIELSSELRLLRSTEPLDIYVRGLDGTAYLSITEVTP